jgi:murein DD-endopeptidase MepM/ murein hydrolase activator NlpD
MKNLSLISLLFSAGIVYIPEACAALQVELSSPVAKQGETVKLSIKDYSPDAVGGGANGAAPPAVQFHGKTYTAFPLKESANVARVLIAVPADLAPGTYPIKVGAEEKSLKVLDGHFPVQSIRLPKGKDNFKSSPGEEEAVDAAKAQLSPHQYWDGKFLHPSSARVSSAFGLRRRVNGVLLKDYFHSGLDFAGATGSPVLATQSGKVLLARHGWKLHGNTICIDHGQGVLSFYIHLSKILVNEGDMVKAGQKIGAVGSTGRANGPHLHFSLYVNKDATNPWDWFNHLF